MMKAEPSEQMDGADVDLAPPIRSVLITYHQLLSRPTNQKLLWRGPNYTSTREEDRLHPQGEALRTLRLELASSSWQTENAAIMREKLLVEAIRRGYVYLVRELLLCPATSATTAQHRPVSIHVVDGEGNGLVHLAVMSKKVNMLKWILKYLKKRSEGRRSHWMEINDIVDSPNKNLETPFSLAILSGKLGLLFAIAKLGPPRLTMFLRESSFGIDSDLLQLFQSTYFQSDAMRKHVDKLRFSDVKYNRHALESILCGLALLAARLQANSVVRDAVDTWARPRHLEAATLAFLDDFFADESMQQYFNGVLCPWWDPQQSSFQMDEYVDSRTEEENHTLFILLEHAVASGCLDSAMWLLTHWKVPPSLLSYKERNYDGDWYLRQAPKVMEKALIGWTSEKRRSLNEEKSYAHTVDKIIDHTLGTSASDTKTSNSKLERHLWSCDIENLQRTDVTRIWRSLLDQATKPNKDIWWWERDWFGVGPRVFASTKLVCTFPLDDFEKSDHAKLLTFFFENVYNQVPNFLAADLPSLAKFVVLDHLPFFQFLTKPRDGHGNSVGNMNRSSYIDLDMPLLCLDLPLFRDDEEDDTPIDDTDPNKSCPICYESMPSPCILQCGHRFHRGCLFSFFFPRLQTSSDLPSTEGAQRNKFTHSVLTRVPHLSFTLGKMSCPYCRQSVKPSLQEALALNLVDGLSRTSSERRKRPNAPNIELLKCSTEIIWKLTVGKALLAFAACSGAIGIFQWLVLDCGIDPADIGNEVGGINVLHHAVAHKRILIVRWLLKNGYCAMLQGGLTREEFDHFDPSLSTSIGTNMQLDLDNEDVRKRLKFWCKFLNLRQLRGAGRDDYEYSEYELGLLGSGMTEQETQFCEWRLATENQSPLHWLLMNSTEQFDSDSQNAFLRSLKQIDGTAANAIPKNWYILALALNLDSNVRDEAKAYLSQQVLAMPPGLANYLDDTALASVASSRDQLRLSLDDFLSQEQVGSLSALDIANNIDKYNLWRLLLGSGDEGGEKDWRPFVQVARALNIWEFWSYRDWFEDGKDIVEHSNCLARCMVAHGRVDIVAAFLTTKRFCDPCSGIFDIFAEEHDSNSFLSPPKQSIRQLARETGTMDIFAPLFARVERVKRVLGALYRFRSEVCETMAAGRRPEEIERLIGDRRKDALELAGFEEPLGVGTRARVMRLTDLSDVNWLTEERFKNDKISDNISVLTLLAKLRDTELLRWILSLLKTTKENTEDGEGDDGLAFLREILAAIISTGELFVFEEFIRFCVTDEKGPTKYIGKKELLVQDLLDVGLLGAIFSKAVVYDEARLRYRAVEDILNKYTTRVENSFRLARWLLDQPDFSSLVHSSEENCKKCLASIFDDESRQLGSSISVCASLCPHTLYRIFNMLRSSGFDLTGVVDEGGSDIVHRVLTWDAKRFKDIIPHDVRIEACASSDEYRCADGNPVLTVYDLVRWLSLEVRVSIQHLQYKDFSRDCCEGLSFSEEELKTLKEDQFAKLRK